MSSGSSNRRTLLFHKDQALPEHPNGMRFRALDAEGDSLLEQGGITLIGGGGFIRKEGEELLRSQHRAGSVSIFQRG